MKHPIIIIGTGLAGYQLARELRKIDAITPLMLVTSDDGRFYSKPQLSTALTSKKTSDMLATATADSMAAQLNATLLTHHTVTHIDPAARSISVGEQTFFYEKLILACGADVIKAPLKGDALDEIVSVNHLYHYATFETLIQHKKQIAILGAGLIGCEFANDLSNAGYDVHIIAPSKTPLDLLLPEKIGRILQAALERNGVRFHLGTVAHTVSKTEKGYLLDLSNGEILLTELILSAIGLKPHTQLAEMAGIAVNRGILVNRYLETSVHDIYALGDCAEVEGHVLPYIAPLLNCTRALAKTLAGIRTAVDYPAMPVMVKTPVHPIAVCPPPRHVKGEWEVQINDTTARALFFDEHHQLYGFVLTNDAVKERIDLAKQIPALF